MTKRVTILAGGWSSERTISLLSGAACAAALDSAGYTVHRVDPAQALDALTRQLTPAPDVVFNALHGGCGENGTMQGLLTLLGVPYTHSGVLASALAMNKPVALRLFDQAGIPTAHRVLVTGDVLRTHEPLPRPYVLKPPCEGSSVGIHIVRDGDPIPDLPGSEPILVEVYVPGRELTVSVLGDRALGVTELRPQDAFYDYAAKYTAGRTVRLCPAPIPDAVARRCMDMAVRAHQALGCRGVTRADFRYDDSRNRLVILELNTQPGMTALSLTPEQAAHAGLGFVDLVVWMVENARCGG